MNILINIKAAVLYLEAGQYQRALLECLDVLKVQPSDDEAMKIIDLIMDLGDLGDYSKTVFSEFLSDDTENLETAEKFGFQAVLGNHLGLQELIDECAGNSVPPDWVVHLMMAGMCGARENPLGAQLHRRLSNFIRAIRETDSERETELESLTDIPFHQREESGSNDVYFITNFLNQRIFKIAKAVQAGGGVVCLVAPEGLQVPECYRRFFDKELRWSGSTQLIEIVLYANPLVFHVFSSNYQNYFGILAALCFGNGRVVSEFYDVFDPSTAPQRFSGNAELANTNRRLLKMQRVIYDNARGLCCRIFYPNITKTRRAGYAQKRIYLPEYSWGGENTVEKLSAGDGRLHVVHGGTFVPENVSGEEHTGFLWLATRAEALGIHFHLYAHTEDSDWELNEYKDLAAVSDYFHLHESVPAEVFVVEISKFDVGISLMYPRDETKRKAVQGTLDASGVWGGKFGDYLDAELYSLCNWRAISINYILKRYGIGEPLVPEKAITKEFWDHVKARILDQSVDFSRARKALAIDGHGKRLMKFYHEVADLAGG